jgi:cyanoexosortase B
LPRDRRTRKLITFFKFLNFILTKNVFAKQKLTSFIEENFFNLVLIVLLGILYVPVIGHWYAGWINKSISTEHEYFSHGLIGLPYAAYIVWENRQEWQQLRDRAHPLGISLLFLGISFYLSGVSELVNLSFPLVLTGACLWLKGLPGLKIQGFPLLLVALATPNSLPYLITPYTLPLQAFIAGTAGLLLSQMGFDVVVDGIYLAVNGKLVEVAPYCAGLKMLFTSLYVALLLLHWTRNISDRPKVVLLLIGSAVISIGANIIRNTLLSWFHGSGNTQLFTWLHDGSGGDLYSTAMLGAIVLLLNGLNRFLSNVEPSPRE